MNSLITLVKVQFKSLFTNFVSQTSASKRKGGGIATIFILFGSMLYVSGMYSNNAISALSPSNQKYAFMFMVIVATGFITFYSISGAQSHLFKFKDFDFLMSLPITKNDIMISKLLSFIMMLFLYSFLLLIPSLIITGLYTHPGIMYYVMGVIGSVFLTFYPAAIGCVFALIIRSLIKNSKYQTLISNVLTFAILMLIIVGGAFSGAASGSGELMDASLLGVIEKVKYFMYPSYLYGMGVINNDIGSFALSILLNVAVLVLIVFLFSKSFIKLNSLATTGYHVKNYKMQANKSKSQFQTLLQKEWRRYFNNFNAVMNTLAGELVLFIGAVFLVINRNDILMLLNDETLPISMEMILGGVLAVVLMFGSLSCITCSSISLEGKQLWITKSSPIDTLQLFYSKIFVNFIVILVPLSIIGSLLCFAFGISIMYLIEFLLVVLALAIFVSLFGIVVNLKFPKFDFDREIIVVKNSMAAFIGMLGGMIIGMGMGFLAIAIPGNGFGMNILIILAIYIVFDIILYIIMIKWGIHRFKVIS